MVDHLLTTCSHPEQLIRRTIGGFVCAHCREHLAPETVISAVQSELHDLRDSVSKLFAFVRTYEGRVLCERCEENWIRKDASTAEGKMLAGVAVCAECMPNFIEDEDAPLLDDSELRRLAKWAHRYNLTSATHPAHLVVVSTTATYGESFDEILKGLVI